MSRCCTHWFLYRILGKLVERHRDEILVEGVIPRHVVFREMSWLHRFSREEAREVFRLMQNILDGVWFGKRGLRISRRYLCQRQPGQDARKRLTDWTGGGA